MHRSSSIIAATLVALLGAHSASAQTIHVPGSSAASRSDNEVSRNAVAAGRFDGQSSLNSTGKTAGTTTSYGYPLVLQRATGTAPANAVNPLAYRPAPAKEAHPTVKLGDSLVPGSSY